MQIPKRVERKSARSAGEIIEIAARNLWLCRSVRFSIFLTLSIDVSIDVTRRVVRVHVWIERCARGPG